MFRNLKVQPNRAALEQLKQRIDVHAVCTQKVRHLGEDRLRRQHRGTRLFHQREGPREWYGSLRFRYTTSGPVSQIVITTAQTCAGRWLQAFGCLPHCPQDQQ